MPKRKKKSNPYWVYILECADSSLYTGITTNIERRFQEHCAGTASKYTRAHKPLHMVYTESCASRSIASKREAAIKKLSRPQKLALIHTGSTS